MIAADTDYAGVSAVIERFGESYVEAHGAQMPFVQLDALDAMRRCRTAACGGHVLVCRDCGVIDYSYHSCGHRACPKCSNQDNDAWLASRASELLPVDYFHVVVTVPSELREAIRAQPGLLYGVLMKAAAKSIKDLMLEQHGVKVGLMAVLHTWNRRLGYHPHVHCVVTAGGLDSRDRWKPVDHDEVALRRILALRFREAFLAMMAKAKVASPHIDAVSGSVGTIDWYVYVDRARGNTQQILGYLARYVHRTALSDRRIVSVDGDRVTYLYRPSQSNEFKPLTVSGHEFLRRFLQHVPPKGFHRVRYYGLWSPSCRKRLEALRDALFAANPDATPAVVEVNDNTDWLACPHCGAATRDIVADFNADYTSGDPTVPSLPARPPPLKAVA